jgi:hypothetical protein
VLADPAIGNFEVTTLLNQPAHRQQAELERFFADRGRDDLLLLYVSCHGVRDEQNDLYLAGADTSLDSLWATAIPVDFIYRRMTGSRSDAVVVVLDCCFSATFSAGRAADAPNGVDIVERLAGRGRVVITASRALEYAFEGTGLASDWSSSSIFSSAFVQGLETGRADLNRDGLVTDHELYRYVYNQVRLATPDLRPARRSGTDGPILIARNPGFLIADSSTLPAQVLDQLNSPKAQDRVQAVDELDKLLRTGSPPFVAAAREALHWLAGDDSQQVVTAAAEVLARQPERDRPEAPPQSQETSQAPESEPEDAGPVEYRPEPVASNDYWTTGDQLEYEPYAIAIAEFIQARRHRAAADHRRQGALGRGQDFPDADGPRPPGPTHPGRRARGRPAAPAGPAHRPVPAPAHRWASAPNPFRRPGQRDQRDHPPQAQGPGHASGAAGRGRRPAHRPRRIGRLAADRVVQPLDVPER